MIPVSVSVRRSQRCCTTLSLVASTLHLADDSVAPPRAAHALLYNVFAEYDGENLLPRQSVPEALDAEATLAGSA